ncbi:MAG: 16S rRNA (cytidine(1402)-2'-O)-methyltransferase [Candidatus Tyrphobacter sp.]
MPLVIVPTPLGNLRDITLRAIDELRACDLLVAEDSRVARKLLGALGIPAREIWSYREHNAATVSGRILERASTQRVVLTTDAGMPAISDPGTDLVAAARAREIAVEVLPGPSAIVGAAVLSGFPLRRFLFEGFPARASAARRAQFERATRTESTSVWFESPKRIGKTLADLAIVAPDARVFLLREYTKLHEEHLFGTPSEIAAGLETPVRGEITFVIAPIARPHAQPVGEAIDEAIDALLSFDMPLSAIAKTLSREGYGLRSDLYARAAKRKRRGPPPENS